MGLNDGTDTGNLNGDPLGDNEEDKLGGENGLVDGNTVELDDGDVLGPTV